MVLIAITAVVFLVYAAIIIYYWRGWESVPEYSPSGAPGLTVSVIVPARNEERNMLNCLESISQQQSIQGAELIAVDDASEDATWEIMRDFHSPAMYYRPLRLDAPPDVSFTAFKKRAIAYGIDHARHDLIVTTDADCIHPPGWLHTVSAFTQETDAVFTAAPVAIAPRRSLLSRFERLDFFVLQGITAACVHRDLHAMCNGANLAYRRTAFEAVNGFEGIDRVASGDDMLLMQKILQKFPGRAGYLKSRHAIVITKGAEDWRSFFNQRIRWSSKARKYKDSKLEAILLMVYLLNLLFPVLIIAGVFDRRMWVTAAVLLAGKILIEFPFVLSVTRYFRQTQLVWFFPLFQPLHIIYTVCAGFFGQIGSYTWKGRHVR